MFKETSRLAREAGYKGIIIFGEPDYYPTLGFKTCDNYNITTADGNNFDAFMGYGLEEGSMSNIKGKFYASEVFEHLLDEEVEKFNEKFPFAKKLRFPGQWS